MHLEHIQPIEVLQKESNLVRTSRKCEQLETTDIKSPEDEKMANRLISLKTTKIFFIKKILNPSGQGQLD